MKTEKPNLPKVPKGVSVQDTAELLGVHEQTVYRMLNRKDLKDLRIGGRRLVLLSSLEEMLKQTAA